MSFFFVFLNGAVRLRALPFFSVQQGCLLVGVSRCGLAAVVAGGVRCFVRVNLSSQEEGCQRHAEEITGEAVVPLG